jgi:cytochrome c
VLDEDKNRVGPYLHGIIGRPAGTAEGFTYSPAMKDSGIVWDEVTIAEYVTDPKAYIPGNRMAFPGLKKQEDVANLMAYLAEATQ